MINFISVKYCLLYLLSMYTIGSYGQISTKNPREFKTTGNNMGDLSTTEEELVINMDDRFEVIPKTRESIRKIDSAVEYLYNYERRLRRFEERLRNFREELETIINEDVKYRGEKTLDRFEDQLVVARNYLRLVEEGESADRLEAYLIDMEKRLEEVRLRYVYIKYIEERGYRTYRAMRSSSDSGEVKERLRRFFVKPRSELHEDILMPQVSHAKRFWNMWNY